MSNMLTEPKQILISYSRVDADFARSLYDELKRHGFLLWRDRSEMEAGENWWLQIEDAIRSVDTMVLCLSDKALESTVVRKEWRYARQEGTRVIPVVAAEVDFKKLPHWMSELDWLDFRAQATNPEQQILWNKFINQLKSPYESNRVPFMVENLPEEYVLRPEVMQQMVAALLDDTYENPKAVTMAIRGAGGYGKTTLARAICHDEYIQRAFDDGILWVTLGETPNPIMLVLDLVLMLTGSRPSVTGLDAAQTKLSEALADRDILLVIDDAWKTEDIKPFMQGGKRCARLITTRNKDALSEIAPMQLHLEAMKPEEASELLSYELSDAVRYYTALKQLAKRLGEWPLLLKLINGTLRDFVNEYRTPLDQALREVNEALDHEGLTAFDQTNSEARNNAVARTLEVSLRQLSQEEKAQFQLLAVFPEIIDIPLPTIGKLWRTSPLATKRMCNRFAKLSLLLNFDAERNVIRLHDVIRMYLRNLLSKDDLSALNGNLLDTYQTVEWSTLQPDEPYLWDWLFEHLWGAKRIKELIRTAQDLRYLASKAAARTPYAVEADLVMAEKIAPEDSILSVLKRQYVRMAHILVRCGSAREAQETLHERLKHVDKLSDACTKLHRQLKTPRLESWREMPDLPPQASICALSVRGRYFMSTKFSSDSQFIVTVSSDNTARIWRTMTGDLLLAINITKDPIPLLNTRAYYSSNNHHIATTFHQTIIIYDATNGMLLHTLSGHNDDVYSVSYSPNDKYIVTASGDKTARIWDATNGTLIRTLSGHTSMVLNATYSVDGQHIVTASGDKTARIWDATNGMLLHTLSGHNGIVYSATYSPNGQYIVTASGDNTARIWDATNGTLVRTLSGHTSMVLNAIYSPDGLHITTFVSSSHQSMKIWNAATGESLDSFNLGSNHNAIYSPDERYIGVLDNDMKTVRVLDTMGDWLLGLDRVGVVAAAYSPNGRQVVVVSNDRTTRVWEAQGNSLLLSINSTENCVAFSPDGGRVAVANIDHKVEIVEITTGKQLLVLNSGLVNSIVYSPDGQYILTAHNTLNVAHIWDATTGKHIRHVGADMFGPHDHVRSAVYSPDGNFITTVSRDRQVMIWQAATGKLMRTLKGHTGPVRTVAYSPNGHQIATGAEDRTVRVWDAISGRLLLTLIGHEGYVGSISYSPNGKHIVSASDDMTVRVWQATGDLQTTLYTDGSMNSTAWHPDGNHIVAGGTNGLYWLRLVE